MKTTQRFIGIRIKDRVQLSISSTRAYFHESCVAMKYR